MIKPEFFFKIHRRLIKGEKPLKMCCPNCGRPFLKINAWSVEISNDGGPAWQEFEARDAWSQQKHTCGAKINLYWKD